MNKIFKRWSNDLIPVTLTLSEEGKKLAQPYKWKNGETYTEFKLNTIGLRTGQRTMNVIDVDTKDLGKLTEPFKSWVEDRLMLEDTLIVESKNGYHFYLNSAGFALRTTTKTGKNQSTIPFIDFRGEGGLIFVDSKTDFADYDVICETEPTTNYDEILAYLPPYQERIESDEEGFENLDDETDTNTTVANENGVKGKEELEALFKNISSSTNRDNWWQLMASAYNMAENKDDAKEVCLNWSKKGDNFTDKGFDAVWKQLEDGSLGASFKGGTLIKAYNETLDDERDEKYQRYLKLVREAKTIDEINDTFKKGDWAKVPICSPAQQKVLPAICATRAREIYAENDEKVKVTVAEFKPMIIIEQTKGQVEDETPLTDAEEKELKDIQIYMVGREYYIRHGNILTHPIGKAQLADTAFTHGIKFRLFSEAKKKIKAVHGVKRETHYTLKTKVAYETRPSVDPTEMDFLYVFSNPFHDVEKFEGRQDIVDDFFTNIWRGKAEDILKLIGLSIRFGETKLNKIHVVAPSNTGKTTFLENVGFQVIHMKRLLPALNADKGIGKGVIDGLKSSGLMLIDEANDPLTQDIKNIDNYIYIDQFGQDGTQEIKLHFTCMTSTHKTAVRGMSDEMYNRLMLIELSKADMGYPLEKSQLFVNENEVYTQTLIDYSKWVMKDALINKKYTKEHLRNIQAKYRLELNSDVDEMLTEISDDIMRNTKSLATEDGVILVRNDEYFIKRKTDLVEAIEDRMSEYTHIDKGKYSDELVKHFLGDAKPKSIKIGGKPIKFYPLNMKRYYATSEDELIDEFDDLDNEFS